MSEGQHPESDAQLVKHQPAKTYDDRYGKQITSSEHRAEWDATFSEPKSVSLTALVGGDDRVREAHRESVRVALDELERYTQARIGNVHALEATGKFIAATFEHDTARPVDGYAVPQLHTHAVVFNMTEREFGAAIDRSMGRASDSQFRQEFEQRVARGEFSEIARTNGRAAPLYTTTEMLRMEREIVGHMQRCNQRGYDDPMLVSPQLRIWTEDRHPEVSRDQRKAVDEIFISREKIVGLDGVAGAGKTTTLSVVRDGAEAEGYKVQGFAPTSRAAHKLAEAGMETDSSPTLQKERSRTSERSGCMYSMSLRSPLRA